MCSVRGLQGTPGALDGLQGGQVHSGRKVFVLSRGEWRGGWIWSLVWCSYMLRCVCQVSKGLQKVIEYLLCKLKFCSGKSLKMVWSFEKVSV